jgi:glycosyltransferase involved in cell wall biosynthesis
VLLFVDYEVPHFDLYAGSRTNFMYLEVLSKMDLQVKFMPADFRRVEPYSSALNELGIETLDGDWYRDNWEAWLKQNSRAIDYVFIHRPDPAAKFIPAVREHTNAAIIYQCHDLHYLRLRRKAEIENDASILVEANISEKKEDSVFSNSDVLLTFSHVEEKYLRDKFPGKRIMTVPLFFYDEVPEVNRDFSQRRDLLFVGSCAHTPNRDAIAWFCSEIFPLIQAKVPGVALNVVGSDPAEDIMALNSESIRILGRVSEEKLADLYKSARMMVVPLRFGAGVKGKVIEALYNGVPLVSTTIGLEGINGIDHFATSRDTPEDFAAEVVSSYTAVKKLEELSRRGSKYVEDNFTADKTAKVMLDVLSAARSESGLRLARTLTDPAQQKPPRLIAFYLPQFHPIPENDEWWGEGFTEWTNVAKAEPLFSGHYQPHVPAELGYYDLRDESARVEQAKLAEQYGIEGFCYYHYWFNGRRLLEHPLQELLASGTPDFPFCLCWANESWTRRWDGNDREILMKQEYSEEDDIRHIRALLPVFEDKRYIRIDGKPVFLVYRTESMPNPARTAELWRDEARKAGIGEIYLCRVESFAKGDPHEINFDAAVEFAPDWANKGVELKGGSSVFSDIDEDLTEICEQNHIQTYQSLVDAMRVKQTPDFKWFRCVTPAWDNWARRHEGAAIFLDSTPEKYQSWLTHTVIDANNRLAGDERMVFVNAWNEWAEGNHLEPDQKFGHAYLEATQKALQEGQLVSSLQRLKTTDNLQVGQLETQIRAYENQLVELEDKISEIQASTSWRVTYPLRWFKKRLLAMKKG